MPRLLISTLVLLIVSCLAANAETLNAQDVKGTDLSAAVTTGSVAQIHPEQLSPDDAVPFKYVGNQFSCIFHRPSCPFAQCISAHHLRFFPRRCNATDQGFKPCRYCLPPFWTTVQAVLIGNPSGGRQAATGSSSTPTVPVRIGSADSEQLVKNPAMPNNDTRAPPPGQR